MRGRNSARERAASAACPIGLAGRLLGYARLLASRAQLCLGRARLLVSGTRD